MASVGFRRIARSSRCFCIQAPLSVSARSRICRIGRTDIVCIACVNVNSHL